MANVVAMCGSLRKGSFNRQLMNASIGLAPAGMTIKEAPSFAKFPLYNFDDQQSTGFPKEVDALNDAIKAADGVLIVSAEYNWSVPGGLKNAIDWISRYKEVSVKDKPVCIVRNADKAKEVLGADTKTAVAELDDRAGLQKALAGAKRVFIVTGHNPKSAEQQINVIEAAKAAGAEFIVKVSGGRDVIGPNVESVN